MSTRSAIQEFGQIKKAVNLRLSRVAIATLDAGANAMGSSRSDAIERLIREMTSLPDIDVAIEDGDPNEILRINVTLTPQAISKLTWLDQRFRHPLRQYAAAPRYGAICP